MADDIDLTRIYDMRDVYLARGAGGKKMLMPADEVRIADFCSCGWNRPDPLDDVGE